MKTRAVGSQNRPRHLARPAHGLPFPLSAAIYWLNGETFVPQIVRRMNCRNLDMPQTEPLAPPDKPRDEPAPLPQRTPPPKPRRELDPFNPDWPDTRPTPEPKAQVQQ